MCSPEEPSTGPSKARLAAPAAALLVLAAVCIGQQIRAAPRAATTSSAPAVRVEADRVVTPEGWLARPAVRRPALPEKIDTAYVIEIHGPISMSTYEAIERKARRCLTAGAKLIVFDLDTPGGRSDAMSKIVRRIAVELRDVYTIAFVNHQAFSAGAIIALACDEIVMTPHSVMGAAMPIMMDPRGGLKEIPEKERGKFESAARAEIRNLARHGRYNQSLCEAMITITIEIWKIRHRQTREIRYVRADRHTERIAGAPSPAGPGGGLFGDEPPPWEFLRVVDGPKELITMTSDEAVERGFVEHVLDDRRALGARYRVGEVAVLTDNWSEKLVHFLTSMPVMSILLFVGLLCAYVEINTPGFGVPGTLAIICFAIVFGANFLTGMAQWWEIAVFGLGLVLIAIEVFVTPGFGVMGIAGLICCVAGLLAMLVANPPTGLPWPDTQGAWEAFSEGVLWLLGALVAASVGMVMLARYLPKVPLAGRLVLAAPAAREAPPASADAVILNVRPGQTGKVTQTCRPVGKVEIAGRLLDAIADGAFLDAGADVVVLRNEGNRIVVEAKG